MIEEWIQTSSGGLVLAALLLAVGMWSFARSRATLRLCPGPLRGWKGWLHPRAWLVVLGFGTRLGRGCGYDLTGLRPDDAGLICCPECGRRLAADRQALRTDVHLWPRRVCVLLALIGVTVWVGVDVRTGTWVRRLPTLAVVSTRQALGVEAPDELRAEWWKRLRRGDVDRLSSRLLAGWLTDDLRHDRQRWNANAAMDALALLGTRAIPALERTCASDDHQARQLAAMTLQRIEGYEHASPAFLAACVEALADDRLKDWGNASASARFLVWNLNSQIDATLDPLLRRAMHADDQQQRLLAAVVAGWRGRTELLPDAAPVLIEALRDNQTQGDARAALPALYRFGLPVRPYLEPLAEDADRQLADSCRLILLRLDGLLPEGKNKDLIWRLNHVTGGRIDPTEFDSFDYLWW